MHGIFVHHVRFELVLIQKRCIDTNSFLLMYTKISLLAKATNDFPNTIYFIKHWGNAPKASSTKITFHIEPLYNYYIKGKTLKPRKKRFLKKNLLIIYDTLLCIIAFIIYISLSAILNNLSISTFSSSSYIA